MRPDFGAVFALGKPCARRGAIRRRPTIRDDDSAPVLPGAHCREVRKGLPEHHPYRHGVLRRFLAASVGRPWSRVRSELAHALGGYVRYRLMDGDVETATRLSPDGRVVDGEGRGVIGFYVDPRDGCLGHAPYDYGHRGRVPERQVFLLAAEVVPVDASGCDGDVRIEFRRVAGVWYEIRYLRCPAPAGARRGLRIQRDGRETVAWERGILKRQLGTREIRARRLDAWPELSDAFRANADRATRSPIARAMEAIVEAARRDVGRGLAPRRSP